MPRSNALNNGSRSARFMHNEHYHQLCVAAVTWGFYRCNLLLLHAFSALTSVTDPTTQSSLCVGHVPAHYLEIGNGVGEVVVRRPHMSMPTFIMFFYFCGCAPCRSRGKIICCLCVVLYSPPPNPIKYFAFARSRAMLTNLAMILIGLGTSSQSAGCYSPTEPHIWLYREEIIVSKSRTQEFNHYPLNCGRRGMASVSISNGISESSTVT